MSRTICAPSTPCPETPSPEPISMCPTRLGPCSNFVGYFTTWRRLPRRVADKAARAVMSTKVYYNTPVQRDPDSFVSVLLLSRRRHKTAC